MQVVPFQHGEEYLKNFNNADITLSVGEMVWTVKVNQPQQSYRLGRGWRTFVNDNGLVMGDVLLFETIDAGFYRVSIFSRT